MKKNWNVAKIFTLLITVLFLASTLFVGCKEQEPEPEPEPSPVMYTVTYAVEGGEKISVTGIPEPKTVEKGTVLKVDDLPTLTEPEGWTFEGWYIGEEPFTSDYTVTSNIIITAKFVENVAPSLPAGGEEGSTTPPAGGEEGSTTPPAGGEEGSTTPPAGGDEGSTTPPAGGEEGSTTPPAGGDEGSTTPPAGGDEGSSTPEPEPTPDTTNNFEGNYYAGDMGYIEFTTETDCVVFVVSEVYATYTVADNVATIKGVKISDEEDYSAIEIKTTTLANDSFSVTYPVEICQIFDPFASENMVITYTKVDNPSSEGGEGVVVPDPDPVETFLVTYTVEGIDANLVTGLPESGTVNEDTVIPLPSLVSPSGYVFDGWFINDELVSQHTVVAAVTIVAKFSEIVPVGTTYTIPGINAEWTNIVVWAWSDEVVGIVVAATNNAGVVTFVSDVEYTGCLVINLKDDNSIEEGATVFPDDAVVANKSTNYELGENNTYKEEEVALSETKIYLAPNIWKADGARFAAYFYGNGETWVDMTDSDGDGIYECSVPEGFPSVIFCRMNPGTTENNWDNKWNQSGDLTVPTDGTNLFTVPDGVWNGSTGSWSTKE